MLATIRAVTRRSTKMARQFAETYAEGNMTALVKIERGGDADGVWDPVQNEVTHGEPDLIWGPGLVFGGKPVADAGIARIYPVTGPITMALGDEPQHFQSTQISIPLRAPNLPQVGDIVTVLAHDDPKLVDRSFKVDDVERGGQLPHVHRMQVSGIEPSRTWRP